MWQVDSQAFAPTNLRSTWSLAECYSEYYHTCYALLKQVSNFLLYLFGPSTFLLRLRDDVKHQAEELTTVQSRLRDCQTALSDAEVLHYTVLYCTACFVHQMSSKLKCCLDTVFYVLPPVKFSFLLKSVIISCQLGDRSDIISYAHHVIVPSFWGVVCHILNVRSKRSLTWLHRCLHCLV